MCKAVVSFHPYRFTGKERDTETGLDYFGARYYGSNMGRFMSPDWSEKPQGVPYAELADPQSLNLYGYVRNNPLNRTDPNGHWCIFGHGTTCTQPPPPPPPPAPKPPLQTFIASGSERAKMLSAKVPGFTSSKFNQAVGNMKVVEVPDRKKGNGNQPLSTVTGNQQDSNTKLGSYDVLGASIAAVTFTGAPGRPIVTGPDFYGDPKNPTSQSERDATMVHEELHAFTGKDDAGLFQMLNLDPAPLQFHNTEPITDAIRNTDPN